MGVGVFLLVLGAILALAVRGDSSVVDLQVVGLILMVAGAVIVYLARRGATAEREVVTIEDRRDPERTVKTVRESVTEQDPTGGDPPPTSAG